MATSPFNMTSFLSVKKLRLTLFAPSAASASASSPSSYRFAYGIGFGPSSSIDFSSISKILPKLVNLFIADEISFVTPVAGTTFCILVCNVRKDCCLTRDRLKGALKPLMGCSVGIFLKDLDLFFT